MSARFDPRRLLSNRSAARRTPEVATDEGFERRATEAAAAGRWEEARDLWRSALDAGPTSAPAIYRSLAKALRKTGEHAQAAEVLAAGRAHHPDDLGLLTDDARTCLRQYRASDEDERHTWKQRLLAAETELLDRFELDRLSKAALTTLGDVSIALRRWPTAIAVWARVAAEHPDRRTLARARLAAAQRQAGDLDSARATLAEVPPEGREHPEFQAELTALEKQLGRHAADQLVAHAFVRLELGLDPNLGETLPLALVTRGHPRPRVQRLQPLVDELARHAVSDASPATADLTSSSTPSQDCRRVLHVCGFLYSGSGAVFDHLRERDDVHLPFSTREVGFLKKANDLGSLVEAGSPSPLRVAAAVAASGLGFGQTGRPLLGYASGSDAALDRFVALARTLLRRLAAARRDDDTAAATAAVRDYLDAVVADLTPADRTALLNNAIIGHQLQRLRLFTDARAVAVLRDPRDQFISQALESPNAMDAAPFVRMMEQRLVALETLLADPELAPRLVVVRFEDFVTDPDLRADVERRLGLPSDVARDERRHFRPEVSRRNIGIHTAAGDPATVAMVEHGLLDRVRALTT